MKMPAAYAAGISYDISTRRYLRREPDLSVVVALTERLVDGIVDVRRVEERCQLSLEGDECSIFHHLLVGLMPEARGLRDRGRGFRLGDQRIDCRIVESTPVAAGEAESAVEDVREGGTTVGGSEPVRDPAGLGDVPMPGLQPVRRGHADARRAVVAGRDGSTNHRHAALLEVRLDFLEDGRMVAAIAVEILERQAARVSGGSQERLALGGVALVVLRGVVVELHIALGAWPDHLIERLVEGCASVDLPERDLVNRVLECLADLDVAQRPTVVRALDVEDQVRVGRAWSREGSESWVPGRRLEALDVGRGDIGVP